MAAVEYSDFVACDLQDIARFFCRFDARIAARFLDAFQETVRFLSNNRHTGSERADLPAANLRGWRVDGFRRYLIFYRPAESGIYIVRVLHSGRDLKNLNWPE